MNECNELREAKETLRQAKNKEIADLNEKYRMHLEDTQLLIRSIESKKTHENEKSKIQLAEQDRLIQQLTVNEMKIPLFFP